MTHDRLRPTSSRNIASRNIARRDVAPGSLTMLAWVLAAFVACSALGMALLSHGEAIGRALAR